MCYLINLSQNIQVLQCSITELAHLHIHVQVQLLCLGTYAVSAKKVHQVSGPAGLMVSIQGAEVTPSRGQAVLKILATFMAWRGEQCSVTVQPGLQQTHKLTTEQQYTDLTAVHIAQYTCI